MELYGTASAYDLNYYYNLYYPETAKNISPVYRLFFCYRPDFIAVIYTEENTYFIHKSLKEPNLEYLLNNIISRQEKIPRKPITLKELLKYADYDYYKETDSKNKLKNYLKSKDVSSEIIETIIKIISDVYRLGYEQTHSVFGIFELFGIEINEKDLQEILSYLTKIYNNSPIWENNGWTPLEMNKNFKKMS